MSVNAIKSTGTIIRIRDNGSGDSFVPIAEVLDIDGPGEKTNFHDATSQDDTAEAVVPSGITRFDEHTFPVNFIPSNGTHDHSTGLRAKSRAKTLIDVQQEYPDGTIDAFSAYVGNVKMKAPVDGILRADIMFRITTAITTT